MAVRDVKELSGYIKAYRSYISKDAHANLISMNSEVGKMLRSMHDHPEKFLTPGP